MELLNYGTNINVAKQKFMRFLQNISNAMNSLQEETFFEIKHIDNKMKCCILAQWFPPRNHISNVPLSVTNHFELNIKKKQKHLPY